MTALDADYEDPMEASTHEEWLASHQEGENAGLTKARESQLKETIRNASSKLGKSASDKLKLWNGLVYFAYAHLLYLRRKAGDVVNFTRLSDPLLTKDDREQMHYLRNLRGAMSCVKSAMTDKAVAKIRVKTGVLGELVNMEQVESCSEWQKFIEGVQSSLAKESPELQRFIIADAMYLYGSLNEYMVGVQVESLKRMGFEVTVKQLQAKLGLTESQLVQAFIDILPKNQSAADTSVSQSTKDMIYVGLILLVLYLL
jgi:hypothetical protein